MFGGLRTDISVAEITRKIMTEHPGTWRSFRLFMKQAAKEIGFRLDDLPKDQQNLLETLFDLAPAFDRHARAVRNGPGAPAGSRAVEDHEF